MPVWTVEFADLNFLLHPERTRAEVRRDYPAVLRTVAERDHFGIHDLGYFASLVEAFGDRTFHTVINRTVRFPETTVAGEPITTYASSSSGANAYRSLAKEVLAR